MIDDLAYVADGGSGLRIIDVSNPVLPVELGALDPSHFFSVFDVEVVGKPGLSGQSARSGCAWSTSPTLLSPLDLGGLYTPGIFVSDIAVVDDLVYVAARNWLRIIDFGPEYALTIPIDLDIKPGSDPNSINPSLEGDLPRWPSSGRTASTWRTWM